MRRLSLAAIAAMTLLAATSPSLAQVSCSKLRWDAGADGAEAEIACGTSHGVRRGMTGSLRRGDTAVATFEVRRDPDPETCWVAVIKTLDSVDPFEAMTAHFDQALAAELVNFDLLSVDSTTRTAIVAAGCRQGVRDGLTGQVLRHLEDSGRVDVTPVATLDVVSTWLDTCKITWIPSGPGHVPDAHAHDVVIVGLAGASNRWAPKLTSGDGAVGSRFVVTAASSPGARLALVRRHPSGEDDFQFGEAVVESTLAGTATAVVVAPLLGDAHVSPLDAAVPEDESACPGLAVHHWSSDEYSRAKLAELSGRLAESERSGAVQGLTSEEIAALKKLLREPTEPGEIEPPTAVAHDRDPLREAGSSVLHSTAPDDDAVVREQTTLRWSAEVHCSNRDLAIRVEAMTEGGRRIEFQEQVGQGKHGEMRVGDVMDRIRSQLKKHEAVGAFVWYVTNMQPPAKKENCMTEKRTAVLAEPIWKK